MSYIIIKYTDMDYIETAVVRCAQTEKQHVIKLKNVSKDDMEPLTNEDLKGGACVIMHHKNNPYPVTFVLLKGEYMNHSCHCVCVYNIHVRVIIMSLCLHVRAIIILVCHLCCITL